MVKENLSRKSCVDVFNSFLVKDANYACKYEIPCIESVSDIPDHLIVFSKATACKDFDNWIHFYEDDYQFERLWRDPEKYLELFKKYKGVILPDFSVYRDMPFVMQLWNIYRGRAIGTWLQQNNVKVIPNIRYGDRRTWKICCAGIAQGGTIAIGSHGTIKNAIDRQYFSEGLNYVVKTLSPQNIVVYGTTPDAIFKRYKDAGINIIQFKSDYSIAHKGGGIMGAGFHGGFGKTAGANERYRIGRVVEPTPKTYEMALNPVMYAEMVAKKYNIHLKGSGEKIQIVYNPNLGIGQYGRTRGDCPNVIEFGPGALYSEKQLANTLAHELNHARSFLRKGDAPEDRAYHAGDSLEDYIDGGR